MVARTGASGTTTLIQTLIMDNSPPRSAVIYARVSSENDRQDTTRQITDLQGYAARENIIVKKVFTEHISGVKKIEERAVLSECLDYCCSQGVEILLLSEISRLGRSTLQVLRSLERLHDAKVSVFIQNLGIHRPRRILKYRAKQHPISAQQWKSPVCCRRWETWSEGRIPQIGRRDAGTVQERHRPAPQRLQRPGSREA